MSAARARRSADQNARPRRAVTNLDGEVINELREMSYRSGTPVAELVRHYFMIGWATRYENETPKVWPEESKATPRRARPSAASAENIGEMVLGPVITSKLEDGSIRSENPASVSIHEVAQGRRVM